MIYAKLGNNTIQEGNFMDFKPNLDDKISVPEKPNETSPLDRFTRPEPINSKESDLLERFEVPEWFPDEGEIGPLLDLPPIVIFRDPPPINEILLDRDGLGRITEITVEANEFAFEAEPDSVAQEIVEQDEIIENNEQVEIETVLVENEKDIPVPAAPNTRYELPNGDSVTTDSQGRVIEKVFTPELTDEKRTPEDNAKTQAVGKEGREDDDGGHIQAHRLGGSSERTNLFPQNSNFNRGAYKVMENQIAKALEEGKDVGKVTVKLTYDDNNTTRPSTVEVSYTIDGKPTVQTYKNEAGGGSNDQRTANA